MSMRVDTPKVRIVRLYGALRARFGKEFRLAVASPAEAVQALSVQLPGFQAFLMGAKDRGMVFSVFNGRRNLAEDQLHDPPGDEMIRIAPVLQGSKRGGVLQTIAGAVLVVAGLVLSAYGFGAIGVPLTNAGIAMVIGGVVQMLSPTQKGLGTQESAANKPSYAFNGPVNMQAQGNPVPAAYGETWAGSAVISGGIFAEDQQ
ncbi:tail assembly protein [Xanthomonas translucens]|uniref:Phage tail protein n=2 Tax=Xanthomonas campestris pv. translucens TaxID=343 RepID=A0A109HRX7_XANCT|nr:tail assembly protein [Xanthomonas translucens]KWV17125.1 phage tail protein [Xanthomonas translucens]QEN93657.1 tail assembly protein [Xanthomonas translucens pv. undulosa]QSQ34720.1 tail assembly protein [Xanthomonas translucens pv. translucens]QSQ58028.1 tail assembly protein [Xanthomonas translucens pv. undulosa]WLA02822.1 tail assembly protein [Xanthomonas translucens]